MVDVMADPNVAMNDPADPVATLTILVIRPPIRLTPAFANINVFIFYYLFLFFRPDLTGDCIVCSSHHSPKRRSIINSTIAISQERIQHFYITPHL
jgi:hypothetical protein